MTSKNCDTCNSVPPNRRHTPRSHRQQIRNRNHLMLLKCRHQLIYSLRPYSAQTDHSQNVTRASRIYAASISVPLLVPVTENMVRISPHTLEHVYAVYQFSMHVSAHSKMVQFSKLVPKCV